MPELSAVDLSSYLGLGAITLLTLNILLGLLMSVKYNPVRAWPHRRIKSSDRLFRIRHKRYREFIRKNGYKPWKYFKGRERWTALPPEFRRRG